MFKIKFLKSMLPYSVILAFCMLLSTRSLLGQSKFWVGTWGCATYAAGSSNTPPSPYIANNTLRQVVRVSIGGDTLRVRFSNRTCATPVTMNSVKIAVSTGGSSIDTSTIAELKFGGSSSVTMSPGAEVASDPVAFNLTPSMRVAISIYYGEAASTADMTGHVASRTDSYILTGDQTSSADFGGAVVTAHWYTISTIEVFAQSSAAVVTLGNSITDGYGLSGGLQNRWPDMFSESLLDSAITQNVGVLNMGIGATNVSGTGVTTGESRYQHDVLDQRGIFWVIIFYGINDIAGGASASTIISTYQDMIDDAHAKNIKVYGATLTPCNGHSYYTPAREVIRNNVNTWIRTPGNFDACIDFDKTIRDPSDTTRLLAAYSNDWLHPNAAGYQLLGESIDRNLFVLDTTVNYPPVAYTGANRAVIDTNLDGSESVTLDGSESYDSDGTITSYIWKEDTTEIASGVNPSVILAVGTHVITLTVTDNEGATSSDNVTITVHTGSNGYDVWLEAECGTVGSLWNINTDVEASHDGYVTIQPGNNSTGSAPASSDGHITYTFDVGEDGEYALWARVITPNANDDSFWLRMDGDSWFMWNNIGPNGSWAWEQARTYNLDSGAHTFTVAYREDGAQLDKVSLTTSSAPPTGEGYAANNCTQGIDGEVLNIYELGQNYPNPFSQSTRIDFGISKGAFVSIKLYNLIGQEVAVIAEKEFSSGMHFVTFDASGLASGTYFYEMKARDADVVAVKKMLLVR